MVFLIQNSQNHDAEAVQIKLDELIRALNGAENGLIKVEECDDDELNRVKDRYKRIPQPADR